MVKAQTLQGLRPYKILSLPSWHFFIQKRTSPGKCYTKPKYYYHYPHQINQLLTPVHLGNGSAYKRSLANWSGNPCSTTTISHAHTLMQLTQSSSLHPQTTSNEIKFPKQFTMPVNTFSETTVYPKQLTMSRKTYSATAVKHSHTKLALPEHKSVTTDHSKLTQISKLVSNFLTPILQPQYSVHLQI